MLGGRGLADPALEVLRGEHDRPFLGQFAHFDTQGLANRDQVLNGIETASIGRRLGRGSRPRASALDNASGVR